MQNKTNNFFLQNRADIWRLAKFASVGFVAATISLGTTLILQMFFLTTQVLANCSGFILATIFAYIVHSKWSFNVSITKNSMFRFFSVTGICFMLTALASSLADHLHIAYILTISMLSISVPLLSYLLHRFWTFRDKINYNYTQYK